MPRPNSQMRQARHPLWRAVAIFALLLVTQLSYAGELCRSVTGWAAPAHAMAAEHPGPISSAVSDCLADAGCPTAASESPACAASRQEMSPSAFAATLGFEPAIFTGSDAPQWTPAVRIASAAFPKLAASSQPPLRNLFCRYLI